MEVEQPGSGWNHPKSEASEEREGRRVGNWQYEWLDPAGCRVSRAPLGVPPLFWGGDAPPTPLDLLLFSSISTLFTLQARHRLVHLRFPTREARGSRNQIEFHTRRDSHPAYNVLSLSFSLRQLRRFQRSFSLVSSLI